MKGFNKYEQVEGLSLIKYDTHKFIREGTTLENGQKVITFTRNIFRPRPSFFTGQLRDIARSLYNSHIVSDRGDLFSKISPLAIETREGIYSLLDHSTLAYTDILLGALKQKNGLTDLTINARLNGLRVYRPNNRSERGVGKLFGHIQRVAQDVTEFDQVFLEKDPSYEGTPSVQIVLRTEGNYINTSNFTDDLSDRVNILTKILNNSQMFDIIQ